MGRVASCSGRSCLFASSAPPLGPTLGLGALQSWLSPLVARRCCRSCSGRCSSAYAGCCRCCCAHASGCYCCCSCVCGDCCRATFSFSRACWRAPRRRRTHRWFLGAVRKGLAPFPRRLLPPAVHVRGPCRWPLARSRFHVQSWGSGSAALPRPAGPSAPLQRRRRLRCRWCRP